MSSIVLLFAILHKVVTLLQLCSYRNDGFKKLIKQAGLLGVL